LSGIAFTNTDLVSLHLTCSNPDPITNTEYPYRTHFRSEQTAHESPYINRSMRDRLFINETTKGTRYMHSSIVRSSPSKRITIETLCTVRHIHHEHHTAQRPSSSSTQVTTVSRLFSISPSPALHPLRHKHVRASIDRYRSQCARRTFPHWFRRNHSAIIRYA
jgi:hypothetical protein